MKIIKRSGVEVEFDAKKIESALKKANESVNETARMSDLEVAVIVENVTKILHQLIFTPDVESIQDLIETQLIKMGFAEVAKAYIKYRYRRQLARPAIYDTTLSIVERNNEEVKQENSNKNPTVNSVQRDYMAGSLSKEITNKILLPSEITKAHHDGVIHFHDADYFVQTMHNCDLLDFAGMVNHPEESKNGVTTALSDCGITMPTTLRTAANLLTQIVAQVASSQYGGQTFTLTDLVGGRHESDINFVELSRKKKRRKKVERFKELGIEVSEEQLDRLVEMELLDEIKDSIQLIQYQLITLQTTNGQAPFVSIFMYLNECCDEQKKKDLALLIEVMLKQRIKGVQNTKGVWIAPAFPKLLYVLEEDNISEDSKYWYLTKLAAECTAKRMVPDYISEKKMLELKGDVYPCMGCRSFLTPDTEGLGENGEHKYYGRFNQGVVTINLPDIALSSGKDEQKFWEIFEDRMENLVHKALRIRHERLLGTPSDVAPILWQHGALARLESGETIDKLLYGNYSTISIGYAGLAECVRYMKNMSHTAGEGKEFALKVMQFMNDKAAKWKEDENISYSLYGTPLESTTYKFAKCLKKRFGNIEGVTDRNYITNSYHVHVTEKIDAFEKLRLEAEFQQLSPGGAISYVEVPNMTQNMDALISIIQYMYETIMYAEINCKIDHCNECGYEGEIEIVEDEHKKLIWRCPNCGCTDQTKMNVARRTCGYIGTQYWNQGRTQEIRDRVTHVSISGTE